MEGNNQNQASSDEMRHQPNQPAAQPIQAAVQPSQLVVQPTQAAPQTSQPAVQPTQAAAQLIQPAPQLIQPQLIQPAPQLIQPAPQPGQAAAQPTQAVGQSNQQAASTTPKIGEPPVPIEHLQANAELDQATFARVWSFVQLLNAQTQLTTPQLDWLNAFWTSVSLDADTFPPGDEMEVPDVDDCESDDGYIVPEAFHNIIDNLVAPQMEQQEVLDMMAGGDGPENISTFYYLPVYDEDEEEEEEEEDDEYQ